MVITCDTFHMLHSRLSMFADACACPQRGGQLTSPCSGWGLPQFSMQVSWRPTKCICQVLIAVFQDTAKEAQNSPTKIKTASKLMAHWRGVFEGALPRAHGTHTEPDNKPSTAAVHQPGPWLVPVAVQIRSI